MCFITATIKFVTRCKVTKDFEKSQESAEVSMAITGKWSLLIISGLDRKKDISG